MIDLLDSSLSNLELITLSTILSTEDTEILSLENYIYQDDDSNLMDSKMELWDIFNSEIIEWEFFESAIKTAMLLADEDLPIEFAEIIVEGWAEQIDMYIYTPYDESYSSQEYNNHLKSIQD